MEGGGEAGTPIIKETLSLSLSLSLFLLALPVKGKLWSP